MDSRLRTRILASATRDRSLSLSPITGALRFAHEPFEKQRASARNHKRSRRHRSSQDSREGYSRRGGRGEHGRHGFGKSASRRRSGPSDAARVTGPERSAANVFSLCLRDTDSRNSTNAFFATASSIGEGDGSAFTPQMDQRLGVERNARAKAIFGVAGLVRILRALRGKGRTERCVGRREIRCRFHPLYQESKRGQSALEVIFVMAFVAMTFSFFFEKHLAFQKRWKTEVNKPWFKD